MLGFILGGLLSSIFIRRMFLGMMKKWGKNWKTIVIANFLSFTVIALVLILSPTHLEPVEVLLMSLLPQLVCLGDDLERLQASKKPFDKPSNKTT